MDGTALEDQVCNVIIIQYILMLIIVYQRENMPLTPKGNSKSHLGHMKASASSNLKEKLKTMALDSHSAFSRHPPYSHPLNSGISSSSQRSGSHTTDTSSTKAISSGNLLLKKIEDLDKETDIFADEVDDSHTHCATLQYNYTL